MQGKEIRESKRNFWRYVVGEWHGSLKKEGTAIGTRSCTRNGVSMSGFGKPEPLQVSGAAKNGMQAVGVCTGSERAG